MTQPAPHWARRTRRPPLPPWPLHACTPTGVADWLVAADRAWELGWEKEARWARRVAKALGGGPRLVLVHRDYLLSSYGGRVIVTYYSVMRSSTLGDFRCYEWWSPKSFRRRRWELAVADTLDRMLATPADWPAMAEHWRDVALAWFRRVAWGVKEG